MMNLTATQSLRRGVAAHKEGKLNEAERYYRAVLESHVISPDSNHDIDVMAEAYCNFGAVQQQRGNLTAAIDSYRQAVQIKPNYIEVYYIMGQALRDKGDLNASIDCYQQAAKIKPNNVDALNNLGAALQYNGNLDAAIDSYKQALEISPDCVEAYNNMGISHHDNGDIDTAIDCYKRALEINHNYANAHNNMGHALHDKGDLNASINCYKSALQIMPDSVQTHNNLGNALREAGEYQEAIKHFDLITAVKANPANPQFWFGAESQAIECLYILGRYAELEQRLNLLAESGDINLRVAAVSTFVTHQLKLADPYPFCKKPLDFFHVGNLNEHVSDVSGFVEDLILEASTVPAVWEPQHGVTKSGFQTAPTVFFRDVKNCGRLEKILRKEIASYYSKFRSEDCAYMNLWPSEYDLRGWFVRLIKNGYQQPHNHPAGWLSGVIYLKTIDSLDTDEGAIELSLHGHGLPILDESYDRKIHRPKKGDIILFPSSLFHRTIPFDEDTERCVIAFDIYRYSR
mgnify:CR=1 FL=1